MLSLMRVASQLSGLSQRSAIDIDQESERVKEMSSSKDPDPLALCKYRWKKNIPTTGDKVFLKVSYNWEQSIILCWDADAGAYYSQQLDVPCGDHQAVLVVESTEYQLENIWVKGYMFEIDLYIKEDVLDELAKAEDLSAGLSRERVVIRENSKSNFENQQMAEKSGAQRLNHDKSHGALVSPDLASTNKERPTANGFAEHHQASMLPVIGTVDGGTGNRHAGADCCQKEIIADVLGTMDDPAILVKHIEQDGQAQNAEKEAKSANSFVSSQHSIGPVSPTLQNSLQSQKHLSYHSTTAGSPRDRTPPLYSANALSRRDITSPHHSNGSLPQRDGSSPHYSVGSFSQRNTSPHHSFGSHVKTAELQPVSQPGLFDGHSAKYSIINEPFSPTQSIKSHISGHTDIHPQSLTSEQELTEYYEQSGHRNIDWNTGKTSRGHSPSNILRQPSPMPMMTEPKSFNRITNNTSLPTDFTKPLDRPTSAMSLPADQVSYLDHSMDRRVPNLTFPLSLTQPALRSPLTTARMTSLSPASSQASSRTITPVSSSKSKDNHLSGEKINELEDMVLHLRNLLIGRESEASSLSKQIDELKDINRTLRGEVEQFHMHVSSSQIHWNSEHEKQIQKLKEEKEALSRKVSRMQEEVEKSRQLTQLRSSLVSRVSIPNAVPAHSSHSSFPGSVSVQSTLENGESFYSEFVSSQPSEPDDTDFLQRKIDDLQHHLDDSRKTNDLLLLQLSQSQTRARSLQQENQRLKENYTYHTLIAEDDRIKQHCRIQHGGGSFSEDVLAEKILSMIHRFEDVSLQTDLLQKLEDGQAENQAGDTEANTIQDELQQLHSGLRLLRKQNHHLQEESFQRREIIMDLKKSQDGRKQKLINDDEAAGGSSKTSECSPDGCFPSSSPEAVNRLLTADKRSPESSSSSQAGGGTHGADFLSVLPYSDAEKSNKVKRRRAGPGGPSDEALTDSESDVRSFSLVRKARWDQYNQVRLDRSALQNFERSLNERDALHRAFLRHYKPKGSDASSADTLQEFMKFPLFWKKRGEKLHDAASVSSNVSDSTSFLLAAPSSSLTSKMQSNSISESATDVDFSEELTDASDTATDILVSTSPFEKMSFYQPTCKTSIDSLSLVTPLLSDVDSLSDAVVKRRSRSADNRGKPISGSMLSKSAPASPLQSSAAQKRGVSPPLAEFHSVKNPSLFAHNRKGILSSEADKSQWCTIKGKRPFIPQSPDDIYLDDVVKFSRQNGSISKGKVMFVGHLPNRREVYVGVELIKEEGKHDGIFEGNRFFKCKPKRGVFVLYSKIIMAWQTPAIH